MLKACIQMDTDDRRKKCGLCTDLREKEKENKIEFVEKCAT
jgi:hypothetical protein